MGAFAAPASTKKAFDLPVDTADRSIKRFSEQAGLEVFYPSSATKGLHTHSVRGEMTARDALAAMLMGSSLRIVEDERTGALAIVQAGGVHAPVKENARPESELRSSSKKKTHHP